LTEHPWFYGADQKSITANAVPLTFDQALMLKKFVEARVRLI
jgi:hypothetical protein